MFCSISNEVQNISYIVFILGLLSEKGGNTALGTFVLLSAGPLVMAGPAGMVAGGIAAVAGSVTLIHDMFKVSLNNYLIFGVTVKQGV